MFTSERGAPFSTAGFARMVERAGIDAKLAFKAHPHMLRHACGYSLANKGHDTRALQAYLGHRNIQHTVRYYRRTALETFGGEDARYVSTRLLTASQLDALLTVRQTALAASLGVGFSGGASILIQLSSATSKSNCSGSIVERGARPVA